MTEMLANWIVQRSWDQKLPYRIAIEQYGRVQFAVRAKAVRLGAGTHACLRERGFDPAEALEDIERAPVAPLVRLGRKLSVTLDRA